MKKNLESNLSLSRGNEKYLIVESVNSSVDWNAVTRSHNNGSKQANLFRVPFLILSEGKFI